MKVKDETKCCREISEERIVIRDKIDNFTLEEMKLAIFVCEEMKEVIKKVYT